MTELDSTRSPALEQQLEELAPGRWSYYPSIPLGWIDEAASRRWTREPDATVVAQFAAAMERGDIFPAILCAGEPRPHGLTMFDGMRIYLASLSAARLHVAAYVVTDVGVLEQVAQVFRGHKPQTAASQTRTYTAGFSHDFEIVIRHDGEDADFAITEAGVLPTVIGVPASEEWEGEAYDEALGSAGWKRIGDWTSYDVNAEAAVVPAGRRGHTQ